MINKNCDGCETELTSHGKAIRDFCVGRMDTDRYLNFCTDCVPENYSWRVFKKGDNSR